MVDAQSFWPQVQKQSGESCWLWTGALGRKGYGLAYAGPALGGNYLAHRVAWALQHGPIPLRMHVAITCGERRCVRHLQLISSSERISLMNEAGKAGWRRVHERRRAAMSETDRVFKAFLMERIRERKARNAARLFGKTKEPY